MKLIVSRSIGCVLLAASTFSAAAFSLQGPGGKIVELNEEYRWNVPIVTYSFDQSFVDYFGQAGVQAVQEAIDILKSFNIETEVDIVSAHRTPEKLFDFSKKAHTRGISVIIAGAGGAAHLPGMVASMSPLPVIGVPVKSSNSIDGWDSVLSILQMPGGVPVATVALNGAKNAGILAAQILGSHDKSILDKIILYKENLKEAVNKSSNEMKK